MIFHDYTLKIDGMIRSHRQTDSARIEPRAVRHFRDLIGGGSFRGAVHPGTPGIEIDWTEAEDGALATFYANGQMLTTSALAIDADSPVFGALPEMLKPLGIQMPETFLEGPAIVSLVWPVPDRENMMLIADMETCLAAAYFEPKQPRL